MSEFPRTLPSSSSSPCRHLHPSDPADPPPLLGSPHRGRRQQLLHGIPTRVPRTHAHSEPQSASSLGRTAFADGPMRTTWNGVRRAPVPGWPTSWQGQGEGRRHRLGCGTSKPGLPRAPAERGEARERLCWSPGGGAAGRAPEWETMTLCVSCPPFCGALLQPPSGTSTQWEGGFLGSRGSPLSSLPRVQPSSAAASPSEPCVPSAEGEIRACISVPWMLSVLGPSALGQLPVTTTGQSSGRECLSCPETGLLEDRSQGPPQLALVWAGPGQGGLWGGGETASRGWWGRRRAPSSARLQAVGPGGSSRGRVWRTGGLGSPSAPALPARPARTVGGAVAGAHGPGFR